MQKDEMRDRLTDALWKAWAYAEEACGCTACGDCPALPKDAKCMTRLAADHLIAHGVTFQRWIPVTERKPELIPNNAGTAYSEAVIVLTAGRKVTTAVWNGVEFLSPLAYWCARGEEITHWTPVLLPLPEPPKEVE